MAVIKSNTETKPAVLRHSNLELLRIFSMLMIIAHHFSMHSDLWFGTEITSNRIFTQLISIGGKLGVNCFILISSHFLSDSTEYRWGKICKFTLHLTVYSVILYLCSVFFGIGTFELKDFLRVSMPLLFPNWWFATTYFVFLLIVPLLGRVIKLLDQRLHLKIVLFIFLIWCIIPTYTASSFESNDLIWFICLFFCTSYIKKYPNRYTRSRGAALAVAIISLLYISASVVIFDLLEPNHEFLSSNLLYYAEQNKLPLVAASFAIFLFFLNLPVFTSRSVNLISSAMFSVYLIHDNRYLRDFVWLELFKTKEFEVSPYLPLYALFAIASVFIVCTAVSLVLNFITDKPLAWLSAIALRMINKLKARIDAIINSIIS